VRSPPAPCAAIAAFIAAMWVRCESLVLPQIPLIGKYERSGTHASSERTPAFPPLLRQALSSSLGRGPHMIESRQPYLREEGLPFRLAVCVALGRSSIRREPPLTVYPRP
jgi:hypothetical protein